MGLISIFKSMVSVSAPAREGREITKRIFQIAFHLKFAIFISGGFLKSDNFASKDSCSSLFKTGFYNLFMTSFLLVWVLFSPLAAWSNPDEDLPAFHKMATQIFPELDLAISGVLETTCPENSTSVLSHAASNSYRKWHERVQKISNSPIPPNAKLLIDHLPPRGFDFILKRHYFPEPEVKGYSRENLILYYFLQIIGTAIKQNNNLQPLQAELSKLFECNNRDCEIQAGITEKTDTPMSSSDEQKLQLFNKCVNSKNSLASKMKDEFCESFLMWSIL